MIDDPETTGATTRSCEEKYERFESEGAADVRAAACGSELPNGYTTRTQAARLGEALGLQEGDRLLDLGSGRGWPGSFLAGASGCHLVAADLPLRALVPARAALRASLGERASVVCADGRYLPLGDGVCDAVCHADVLC